MTDARRIYPVGVDDDDAARFAWMLEQFRLSDNSWSAYMFFDVNKDGIRAAIDAVRLKTGGTK